eukprot:jgi/Chlat1/2769/Chrsp187S02906
MAAAAHYGADRSDSPLEGLERAARQLADVRTGVEKVLDLVVEAGRKRETQPARKAEGVGEALQTECGLVSAHLSALRNTFLGLGGLLPNPTASFPLRPPPLSLPSQPDAIAPTSILHKWRAAVASQAARSKSDSALSAFQSTLTREFPALAAQVDNLQSNAQISTLVARLQSAVPDAIIRLQHRTPMGYRGASDAATDAASASGLQLQFPGVWCAAVAFSRTGSAFPEAVSLFSDEEATTTTIDPWHTSAHAVFRYVAGHAMNALFFFQRVVPHVALETLLLWLATYRNLFDTPCSGCKQRVAADPITHSLLPPVLRPYYTFSPASLASHTSNATNDAVYHVQCYPDVHV